MEEIWKDIVIEKNGVVYDYTGLYQVSNYGRVKSLDRVDVRGHKIKGKVLKLGIYSKKYQNVVLYKNGKDKKFSIHRLVATAFIPNPDNLPIINHIDENPLNNCVDNLEWCSYRYNSNYGTRNERISEKLKGQQRSEEHKQKLRDNHSDVSGDKNPRARKVICLETLQVFTTIKEAAGWCSGNVKHCLRGITKSAGGYHWMYLDDYKRQLRLNTDINNSRLVA